MNHQKHLQIGVIGSYKDKYYQSKLDEIAFQTGAEIAKSNCILIVGPEPSKKLKSGVIAAAAKGAKSMGGTVVGILPRINKNYLPQNIDITIFCGGEMGGIREVVLTCSCNAIISIAGGAGTLCEMSLAYHNRIPLVALQSSGGTSTQFAGKYLDYRKEIHDPVFSASSPTQAVEKAIRLAKKRKEQ